MRSLLILVTLCGYSYCQFSSTGQKNIVDAHNRLRSSIAKGTYIVKGTKKPAGSNILKIKWDKTVATSAQSYANKCPTGHSKGTGYGENLYWRWSTSSPKDLNEFGLRASDAWSSEFGKYGWKTNKMDRALFGSHEYFEISEGTTWVRISIKVEKLALRVLRKRNARNLQDFAFKNNFLLSVQ
ncbi:hypothetical protein L5515_011752 [Caenorhabditis briggsae]|uniref:SCP domain-containing protein n=1 Tax=Caenorhabditis briggsae TaxID=6238 RepID=A0AAE9EXE5_CAEBR|nr:hypothetical protein L5515_011752 [Caenorhabditis briggsae]